MTGKATRFSSLALSICLVTAITGSAFAAGSDTPSPPPPKDGKSDGKAPPKDSKMHDTRSSVDDPDFLAAYRAA